MIYESFRKYSEVMTLEDQAIFARICRNLRFKNTNGLRNLSQTQDERDAMDMLMRCDLLPHSGIWKLRS